MEKDTIHKLLHHRHLLTLEERKELYKQVIDIFNNLNQQCEDLTGMELEELVAWTERITNCPEPEEEVCNGINEYDAEGEYSEYCETCDCITTFSEEYPYGTCYCS